MFVRSFPEENREALYRAFLRFSKVEEKRLEIVAFHPEKDREIAKDIAQYLRCPCVILSQFSQIIPYFEKLKAVLLSLASGNSGYFVGYSLVCPGLRP